MHYYKNSATPERLKWWQELPANEQYLRTQLYRLKKWDEAKEKKMLRYPENARSESQRFLKNNIRLLEKAIKAIKRRLPAPGHWRRTETNAVAWCCGVCNKPIPGDSEYCPYCGQKVKQEV